jgi:ferredoxin
VCGEKNKQSFIDFAFRGYRTRLNLSAVPSTPGNKCASCGECIAICPTAALQSPQVQMQLDDKTQSGVESGVS